MNFLEEEDSHIISHALAMWANYIETGNPVLSSDDQKAMGNEKQAKSLSEEQHQMVVRLRQLAKRYTEIH